MSVLAVHMLVCEKQDEAEGQAAAPPHSLVCTTRGRPWCYNTGKCIRKGEQRSKWPVTSAGLGRNKSQAGTIC